MLQARVGQELNIDGIALRFAEHSVARGTPYGQEGRQAVVYQLVASRLLSRPQSLQAALRRALAGQPIRANCRVRGPAGSVMMGQKGGTRDGTRDYKATGPGPGACAKDGMEDSGGPEGGVAVGAHNEGIHL